MEPFYVGHEEIRKILEMCPVRTLLVLLLAGIALIGSIFTLFDSKAEPSWGEKRHRSVFSRFSSFILDFVAPSNNYQMVLVGIILVLIHIYVLWFVTWDVFLQKIPLVGYMIG